MSQPFVLITGATAGIGRHTALHLARRGLRVIATGRRADALASLLAEAKGLPLNVVELDVTREESIARAHEEVLRITGGHGVDVLVNNAGWGAVAPVLETTDSDLRAQYETNVFGLMAVTRAFAKEMLERRSGRIVNVSSIGGRVTLPFFGAYNSTKFAVESLSDALRRELAPLGIKVSLIEPGVIRTEFTDKTMGFVDKYQDDASPWAGIYQRAEEIRKQSDARAAGPECVARVIEHASVARRPRARYVTPLSGRVFVWFATWLPTSWVDFVFVQALTRGMKKKADAAPVAPRAVVEKPRAEQVASLN